LGVEQTVKKLIEHLDQDSFCTPVKTKPFCDNSIPEEPVDTKYKDYETIKLLEAKLDKLTLDSSNFSAKLQDFLFNLKTADGKIDPEKIIAM
jgi:hypothetical protein